MFVAKKSMWDFVVFKHGHESSQGVLISMILINHAKYVAENFESSSVCKKIVKCCEVTLFLIM